jgi:hypothetical protein
MRLVRPAGGISGGGGMNIDARLEKFADQVDRIGAAAGGIFTLILLAGVIFG